MTDYLKPSFKVALGSKNYRDNYDAVFGKKPECEHQWVKLEMTEDTRCAKCGAIKPEETR